MTTGTPSLNKALALAQSQIRNVIKGSDNPFFKSKYADLSAVVDALRSPLTSNGLSVTQTTRYEGGVLLLVTTLRHESGEEVSGEYPIIPADAFKDGKLLTPTPQAYGSAMTYARRYSIGAICGLFASEIDDDGNEASGLTHKQAPAKPAQPVKATMTPQQWDALGQRAKALKKDEQGEALMVEIGKLTKSCVDKFPGETVDRVYDFIMENCK